MFNIIILLAIITLNSEGFDRISLLEGVDKELYLKAKEIQSLRIKYEKQKVFVFISNSLSEKYIFQLLQESYELYRQFGIKTHFVYRGLFFDGFEKFADYAKQRLGDEDDSFYDYVKSVKFEMSPSMYSDLNITKVPVFAFAISDKINFIAKGEMPLEKFINIVASNGKVFND